MIARIKGNLILWESETVARLMFLIKMFSQFILCSYPQNKFKGMTIFCAHRNGVCVIMLGSMSNYSLKRVSLEGKQLFYTWRVASTIPRSCDLILIWAGCWSNYKFLTVNINTQYTTLVLWHREEPFPSVTNASWWYQNSSSFMPTLSAPAQKEKVIFTTSFV